MRYIIIYAVSNPTPKGVGYDLNVHFVYFRSPKFIAPKKTGVNRERPGWRPSPAATDAVERCAYQKPPLDGLRPRSPS